VTKKYQRIAREDFDAKIDAASEIDWCRLATYIDAEGSIVIERSEPQKRFRQSSPVYGLRVSVSNTGIRIIDYLIRVFGSGAHNCDMKHNPLGKKQGMQWVVQADRAAIILRRCMPYLIEKREQAENALAFQRIKQMGTRGKKVSAFQLQLRDRCYRKIKVLNGSFDREKDKREKATKISETVQ
jgi:hypothetical protein